MIVKDVVVSYEPDSLVTLRLYDSEAVVKGTDTLGNGTRGMSAAMFLNPVDAARLMADLADALGYRISDECG